MVDRTSDETKAAYQQAMGPELGKVFHAIVAEVAYLNSKWADYLTLYDSKARVDLLNKAAPSFFGRHQQMCVEDMFLHIARLTDKPFTGKKANLTVSQLVGLATDPRFAHRLQALLVIAEEKAEFCRDWRNRKIAHNDFDLALGRAAVPLAPTQRFMTREAIEAINSVICTMSQLYNDATMVFDDKRDSSAVDVIYVLYDGVQREELRKKRIAKGQFLAEDFDVLKI